MISRILYAVLVAVVLFVVLTVIGSLLKIPTIAAYAGVIAVLAGLYVFFSGKTLRG